MAEGRKMKISDFGLSRDVYEEDSYVKKSKVPFIECTCRGVAHNGGMVPSDPPDSCSSSQAANLILGSTETISALPASHRLQGMLCWSLSLYKATSGLKEVVALCSGP